MRSVAIAKGVFAWFVIDPMFGISVLFSADTKKECQTHCKEKGYTILRGEYEW